MIQPGALYDDDDRSRTVEELAAEQGITGPQPLDSLRSDLLDEDERQAFVEAAEARRTRGYYCEHTSITSSHLVGIPTVGCGCAMLPLAG